MSEQDQLPFLPLGWIEVKLGEVLPIEYGKGLPQKARDSSGQVPVYGSNGLVGWHSEALTSSATLIIGRKGGAGQVHYSSVPCWPIDTAYYIEAAISEFINLRYFSHLLKTVGLEQLDKSTAIPSLSRDDYNQVKVPLAPLAEQQRIVDEIEKQFSRLDAAVEMMQRVKRNLGRLRTATLKAAVEGRLVPTEGELARAEGREYEPADVLLQRILRERREKWEADQLAKMKKQGKTPKDDKWKTKYLEPAIPNAYNLPAMPEGWTGTLSDSFFFFVTSGSRGWAEYYSESGALFLRVGNLNHNSIDLDLTNIQRVNPPKDVEGARTKVQPGDILISITADVGMVALIPETLETSYVNQHIALTRPIESVNRKFLAWYLASEKSQKQFSDLQRGATKMGLGLDDIRSVLVSLPPIAEQDRIIAEVERRISVIEELKMLVTNALRRASILRQKILRDAFAGKLVPQDPADEHAGVLLERIRAEKAQRGAEAQQARKERRGKMKERKAGPSERKPRRPLRETVADSKQRLTPEQLFAEAGFTLEIVEDFYEELRREINARHIEQVRPDNAKVYLIAADA